MIFAFHTSMELSQYIDMQQRAFVGKLRMQQSQTWEHLYVIALK